MYGKNGDRYVEETGGGMCALPARRFPELPVGIHRQLERLTVRIAAH